MSFYFEFNFFVKLTVPYNPYFYVKCRKNTERDVLAFLSRKYVGKISRIEIIEKEDLDLVIMIYLKRRTHSIKQYNIFCNSDELVYQDVFLFKANHLIGLKQSYLKLIFLNVDELTKVRKDLTDIQKCTYVGGLLKINK